MYIHTGNYHIRNFPNSVNMFKDPMCCNVFVYLTFYIAPSSCICVLLYQEIKSVNIQIKVCENVARDFVIWFSLGFVVSTITYNWLVTI